MQIIWGEVPIYNQCVEAGYTLNTPSTSFLNLGAFCCKSNAAYTPGIDGVYTPSDLHNWETSSTPKVSRV